VTLFESQEQIIARVKTIPNIDVYEDEVPDETMLTMIGDQIKPYLTISFGGTSEAPRRMNGIAGAAQDTDETSIVIQCVASTKRAARQLHSIARTNLLGFIPDHCGEIRNALYNSNGAISHLVNPTRYASTQSFRYYVNAPQISE
jgi:hypothetical protein